MKKYYQDLSNNIKRIYEENNNFKENYEKDIYCILKYALNISKTLEEAVYVLKILGIDSQIENKDIIIKLSDIKISSRYLKLDISKQLDKQISWQYELFKSVNKAKYKAISKEDFEDILKQDNIKVIYNDKRKYITFIDKYSNKRRNNKLYPPENFTKEELERQFEKNRVHKEKNEKRKYVSDAIKDCLEKTYSLNMFKEKLKNKNIKLTIKDETLEFEYENEKFSYEDKYFKYDYKYIQNIINSNNTFILSCIGHIFRVIDSNSKKAENKNISNFINRSISSLSDKKSYISEMKKGKTLNNDNYMSR